MNINFLNFGISAVKNMSFNGIQSSVKIPQPKGDTFEKSVNFTGIGLDDTNWNKAKIKAIYDETYDKVIGQNPVAEELNMEKPEMLFTLDEWHDKAFAAYTILLNAVEVSNKLKEDCYLVTMVDKNGKATHPISVTPESTLITQQMLYGRNPGVKFIKLNNSEKEKFASAVLAHEFRHCIQEHLLLSTGGCEEHLDFTKEAAKEAQKELLQSIEEETAAGRKASRMDRDYARCLNYIIDYEPKNILSPDTKFNFSTNSRDKRAISVIKHLLPTAKPENRINQINDAYYAQPFEIDAYNYESEFLDSLIAKKNVLDNSREDVLTAMVKLFKGNAELGISNMQKYGFAPFDKI